MTVNTTTNRAIVLGDGVQTVFEFPFIGVATSDIYVTYTDEGGVSTSLSPSQFSVSLNPALPGAIWGVGGTVTYPLSGSPIADGTSLTIERILPETQETQISNQSAFYPQVVEREFDLLTLQIQQVSDQSSRALVVPVTDPNAPLPIPGVQQRAGQMLGFDALGNPIAAEPSGALVSSAMQPVVAAATLPLARAAMGVNYPTQVVNTDQTPGLDEYGRQYKATASVNVALPKASDTFNGYSLSLQALSGDSTFTPDGADAIYGLGAGVAQTVSQGATGQIVADGVATWYYAEITNDALVGEIKDFGGFAGAVPTKYLPCDGAALVRTDYPDLLIAITVFASATRTFNNTTISGLTADLTDQLAPGMAIEGDGIQANTTITSVSTTSIVISNVATSSGTGSIQIFAWGNGNGTTTFNVPDLRGRSTAGPDKYAGGSAANRLTSTYFGTTARIGRTGGGESQTLTQAQLPAVKPAITINDIGHNHGPDDPRLPSFLIFVGSGAGFNTTSGTNVTATSKTTTDTTGITAAFTNNLGSGNAHTIVQPTAIVNKIIRALP